jgi:hypothetical protein
VSGTLETRRAGRRSWARAAAAALLGWLFVVLLLILGVRPLGWVLCGAAVSALALALLYARARRLNPFQVFAFAFACIMLEWPVLALLILLILSWTHVARWE